jgi:hypothetical protein
MADVRIAVVGARRLRQGLGPYVIRHLRDAGARVAAFVARTAEGVAAARAQLGQDLPGYTDFDALRAAHDVNALAILTPPETHAHWLRKAVTHGLHALCEKPLIWGLADPARTAREIVREFQARRLVLFENCQWPMALPAFYELHPELRGAPVRSFGMTLSPVRDGADALLDAMPHVLSVAQALVPDDDAELDSLRFEGAEPLTVRFAYIAGSARLDCVARLPRGGDQPRAAAIEVNGRAARREVRMADYSMRLVDGERAVPMIDPLALLVQRFVAQVESPSPALLTRLGNQSVRRMVWLESILAEYKRQRGA